MWIYLRAFVKHPEDASVPWNSFWGWVENDIVSLSIPQECSTDAINNWCTIYNPSIVRNEYYNKQTKNT